MTLNRLNDTTLEVKDVSFDAQLTLIDSAQVFHWQRCGEKICAVSSGRSVSVIQREEGLLLENCRAEDENYWINYFDLDRDYEALLRQTERIPIAHRAIELLPGLRVLRQPPWEALVAFIISANNNVSRIRGIVARLIDNLGEKGAFPTPSRLGHAEEAELRALGCGYRAPYLIETAKRVAEGFDLQYVAQLPYEEAHRLLLTLPGVGDKVADCVQLFGMGHSMAFPVDVWVERLMKGWFLEEKASKREIRAAAHDLFGDNAGLIQQSLFHCARMGLIEL